MRLHLKEYKQAYGGNNYILLGYLHEYLLINLFPLIPACTGRPGLPLLPASSARPGLPLSAPANGFDDERHRQSPSHHSFESVIYT